MTVDISAYAEDVPLPSPEQTRGLADLIKALADAELAVMVAEQELEEKKAAVKNLEYQQIPELMRAMRMELFGADGLKVELVKEYWCSITAERRAAAHKWLRENNQGGLIKKEIVIPFAMGQEEQAAALEKELGERFPGNVASSEGVHAQTLKAFVKRQMEANTKNFPAELFGAQEVQKAKIKRPKTKKQKDNDE